MEEVEIEDSREDSRCQGPETINEFYKDSMNLKLVVYRSVLNFEIHTLIM